MTRGGNELKHYIVSETKQKGHSQLTIAAHLTSYAFIADKLYKNPYIVLIL